MVDTMGDALRRLVREPGDDEVDAALRAVEHRARRRGRTVAAATAAAAAVVVAVAAGGAWVGLAGDDDPDVRTDPSDATTSTAVPPAGRVDTERILAEIRAYVDTLPDQDLVRSTGFGGGDGDERVVVVELRADATEVAEEVHARWPDRVQILLGNRTYPDGLPVDAVCPEVGSGVAVPGLDARLELDHGGVVASGADLDGRLVLTNTTDREISFSPTSWPSAVVVEAGGSEVLGHTTQAFAGPLQTYAIPPEGSAEIPIVVGTTTCSETGPPGLPAGEYEALLVMTDQGADPTATEVHAVTARASLTVE